jgi:hypothetical protein
VAGPRRRPPLLWNLSPLLHPQVRVQGLSTESILSESIDLLTVWLISADFVVKVPREHQEGYNVRSDGGDEARCGWCYTTTVRR